jgi:hypothetical protein
MSLMRGDAAQMVTKRTQASVAGPELTALERDEHVAEWRVRLRVEPRNLELFGAFDKLTEL